MTILILYIVTAGVILVADAVALPTLIKPVFERHVGDILADPIRLAPAAVFYLFYAAAVVWLVSLPALDGGSLWRVALNGAVLGAAAYGTYEFTNLATIRGWSWQMVATDLTWGTFLTAAAAVAGVAVARAAG